MRSAIAGTKVCEAVAVNLQDGLARLGRRPQTGSSRLREALLKVPGVKTVSEPDKNALVKLTFEPTKKTPPHATLPSGQGRGGNSGRS